jgi:hypothetical protein
MGITYGRGVYHVAVPFRKERKERDRGLKGLGGIDWKDVFILYIHYLA